MLQEKTSAYQDAFKRAVGLFAGEPEWLGKVRQDAIARFVSQGLPTTKQEDWRFTSLVEFSKKTFDVPMQLLEDPVFDAFTKYSLADTACVELVFINGRYQPKLSSTRFLPNGVRVEPLSGVIEKDPDMLKSFLQADLNESPFTALNQAFSCDGAFVQFDDNTAIDAPVHLLFVSLPAGSEMASHPRVILQTGKNASASLVETFVGSSRDAYLSNVVTDVRVGENSRVDFFKNQQEGDAAYHFSRLCARVDKGGAFHAHAMLFGGLLVRDEIHAVFEGEGGEVDLGGLFVPIGRQHMDTHTCIEHARPRCKSREIYKGVLNDAGRGVFTGKIHVHKSAQETDATQSCRNLLLSEQALVNAQPQLEIYADNVKCSHGAAIGQVEEDAVFYLRSRGMDEASARALLVQAFACEVLANIQLDPLKKQIEQLISSRLYQNKAAS